MRTTKSGWPCLDLAASRKAVRAAWAEATMQPCIMFMPYAVCSAIPWGVKRRHDHGRCSEHNVDLSSQNPLIKGTACHRDGRECASSGQQVWHSRKRPSCRLRIQGVPQSCQQQSAGGPSGIATTWRRADSVTFCRRCFHPPRICEGCHDCHCCGHAARTCAGVLSRIRRHCSCRQSYVYIALDSNAAAPLMPCMRINLLDQGCIPKCSSRTHCNVAYKGLND